MRKNDSPVVVLALLMIILQAPLSGCAQRSSKTELFTYAGGTLPRSAEGWQRAYASFEEQGAQMEKGVLHITDDSTAPETAIFYFREWPQSPDRVNVAEFDVKVVKTGGNATTYYPYFPAGYVGMFIGTSDGAYNMVYTLYADRILSSCAETSSTGQKDYRIGGIYRFDTTARFNRYRAMIENGVASLFINDVLVLRQSAGKGMYNINGIEFGAGSSQGTGEAYIDGVRAYQVKAK